MAVAGRSTDVRIEGEIFSLVSTPDERSELVQRQKELLLGQLNLQDLSGNLGRVGQLVHLAYFAAKGCGYGPGMVDLKMTLYELGTDVTRLSSISSNTVSIFQDSSYGVIQELKAAAEYLLEGFEEGALDCLESLSTTAKRMAEEARNLKQKFEEKEYKVIAIIHDLEKIENERGINKESIQKQQRQLNAQIKQYKEEKRVLRDLEEEARLKKKHYQQKRDKDGENHEEPSFMQAILKKIKGTPDSGKERISEWKELVIQHYEIEKKQRELYNKKLEQELASICTLGNCKDVEGDLGTAINCLQQVTNALQHLESVMSNAAEFWNVLSRDCDNLSHPKMEKSIARLIDEDEELRLQKWHSNRFKKDAVKYCAKWVALHSTCNDYIENARYTQAELRSYNIENPSAEDARKMLPNLLQKFKQDTQKLIHINERQISATQEKIREKQNEVDTVD